MLEAFNSNEPLRLSAFPDPVSFRIEFSKEIFPIGGRWSAISV
jgi:hypothetical protein